MGVGRTPVPLSGVSSRHRSGNVLNDVPATVQNKRCTRFPRLRETGYKMYATEVGRCLPTGSGAIDGEIK